ncbi:MAG: DegV family protein [Clostridiales bacterium]|nr:MAG: DegV family protein [Clostridiales bacterium]
MGKIKVSAETTCDLSAEVLKKYNISIIPLNVIMGEETFLDGINIHKEDIFEFVEKTKILPKTAAPSVGVFSDFFTELTKDGSSVIHISISSGFSSTVNNAEVAAREVGNVYVIDSFNLSTGIGLSVVEAAVWAQKDDVTPEQIVEHITKDIIPCVDASFIIDRLDYLYKGGRCSGVAVLGANLLKLKPCIEVTNGKMDVGKKYRGSFKDAIKTYVKDRLSGDKSLFVPDRVFITSPTRNQEFYDAAHQAVEEMGIFKEIIETSAGCTITSHCGEHTIGILFVRTQKKG